MLTCAVDRLKDVIQNLFEIQSAVHGYLGPETQQELVRKMYYFLSSDPTNCSC
jgi:mediator of RNA polymerase II transcription subunit 10